MFYRSARAVGAIAIILSFSASVRAFQASEPERPTAAQAALYISPYESGKVKLMWLYSSPNRILGAGVRVQFNQKHTFTLLLDSGASGISLSPKAAEKAGLEMLDVENTDVKGVGDDVPGELHHYVASEVRVGDVAFADCPVAIFRSARSADSDGLLGPDVFQRFLLTIDFPKLELDLTPRPDSPALEEEPADAPDKPPAGYNRALRMGSHLAIYTYVNEKGPLFLIDSGSSSNLLDVNAAREYASVSNAPAIVRGVQGKVKDTSQANRVTLLFAGFRQENSSVVAFDFDKISESHGFALSGIIGFPILSQLKVSIDYHDGNVRFEKGK